MQLGCTIKCMHNSRFGWNGALEDSNANGKGS
jgi:hypothetical protein